MKALEIFLHWLVSLLVGKLYSFPVIIYWLWVADISTIFIQTFWRHRERMIFHCWWACQQTTLQKLFNVQHQRWWSSRQKMSNLQKNLEQTSYVYYSFRCQLFNRHHKQCIKYNDVYIKQFELCTGKYSSRCVTNPLTLWFDWLTAGGYWFCSRTVFWIPCCALNMTLIWNLNIKATNTPTKTHPPIIEVLQTTRITKLGLLSSVPINTWQKLPNIRIEKQIHVFPYRKTISYNWGWKMIC